MMCRGQRSDTWRVKHMNIGCVIRNLGIQIQTLILQPQFQPAWSLLFFYGQNSDPCFDLTGKPCMVYTHEHILYPSPDVV